METETEIKGGASFHAVSAPAHTATHHHTLTGYQPYPHSHTHHQLLSNTSYDLHIHKLNTGVKKYPTKGIPS